MGWRMDSMSRLRTFCMSFHAFDIFSSFSCGIQRHRHCMSFTHALSQVTHLTCAALVTWPTVAFWLSLDIEATWLGLANSIYGYKLKPVNVNFRFHKGHEPQSPDSRSTACFAPVLDFLTVYTASSYIVFFMTSTQLKLHDKSSIRTALNDTKSKKCVLIKRVKPLACYSYAICWDKAGMTWLTMRWHDRGLQHSAHQATLWHAGECLVERDERGIALDVWPVNSRRPGHFNDKRMTKSDWIDV